MVGTVEAPLRVAIVGAGPSAFYAAGHLLAGKAHPDLVASVDMFDRLPTPWGLVRAGVAPDHPKIKSVSRMFERTARSERFAFIGGVEIGRDVSVDELRARYHALIVCIGAETDKPLGIPGDTLPGSVPATEFVAWYNGHPDYADREFDLTAERAVVVGNGNVALDVARMLLVAPDELARTDIADNALEALRSSQVREVVVLGRRGPAQAAFTNPELLELGELEDVDVIVDPRDMELDEHSRRAIEVQGEATERRNVEILADYAQRKPKGAGRRVVLRFLTSPVAITGSDHVTGVEVVRNRLARDGSGVLRARPTDEHETIPCHLVFRSIGYRGVALAGLPFDEAAGVIPNDEGRVLVDAATRDPVPGAYVAGWIKRGPTGVIGTNKRDAQETVDLLVADAAEGRLPEPTAEAVVPEGAVTYTGWQAIDAAEKRAGEQQDRPRVKLTRMDELLGAARG